jgi:hypothetical protein
MCLDQQIFARFGVVDDIYIMRDDFKQSRGMLSTSSFLTVFSGWILD